MPSLRRSAVNSIFHDDLRRDPRALPRLRPQNGGINKRQAFVIEGAELLPNPRGTAPGQWIDSAETAVICCCPVRRTS